jgi:hypothetical protein
MNKLFYFILLSNIALSFADDTDDYYASPYQFAVLVFVIITILVGITIIFEFLKDYAIESADKYTR